MLIPHTTPTLDAVDETLAKNQSEQLPRCYLGASSVGHQCLRKSWFDFRWFKKRERSVYSIKCIEDGHRGEDMMADRLRMVEGVELLTIDSRTGKQYKFVDLDGHFSGHADGIITGLLEAPKTPHVWEHKQVDEKKLNALLKLIETYGEKEALAKWDYTYYIQAQLYMHYLKLRRHFLTVSTPGGRKQTSCRTEYNADIAEGTISKAKLIIETGSPPPPITTNPAFFICRMCEYHSICHKKEQPQQTCRSCVYASPGKNGEWYCGKHKRTIDYREQGQTEYWCEYYEAMEV